MQLHKAFNAHVQIKVEGITKNFINIDHSLLDNLIELQENPSNYTLERVTDKKGIHRTSQCSLLQEYSYVGI